jgi:hypothetical protein
MAVKSMYRIIIFFQGLIVAFLLLYLGTLAGRTNYLTHSTSIGFDVIIGYHILSVIVLLMFALTLKFHLNPRWFNVAGLTLSLIIWSVFLILNITGQVWCYEKEGSHNMWEMITGAR